MLDFNEHVLKSSQQFGAVVQPRMGFSRIADMREGLRATASSNANSVCTITLDSFTRVNDFTGVRRALAENNQLNGYPLIYHKPNQTKKIITEIVRNHSLPVQIRHGSPLPSKIFQRMVEVGVNATEGGPISYCLPYSRVPLKVAVEDWEKSCRILSAGVEKSHIETFSGCMLGQLCDPAVLIALNIIEGLFLTANGINSISFSYAQGTSKTQDKAALTVLKKLAGKFFSKDSYHIVSYVFMGYFPKTMGGYCKVTNDMLNLINTEKVNRVIVKTPVEARRIPNLEENIASIEFADYQLKSEFCKKPIQFDSEEYDRIYTLANQLISDTLSQDKNIGKTIIKSFSSGILSIPYCLHSDNKRTSHVTIDKRGYCMTSANSTINSSANLIENLKKNIEKYDL
ncbi:MAG: hypothetical protein OFPII_42430 [Osedax symbiont Rs1]|nr:MAG: hypothetical protein OFPII_42430 [Osedax symbiont Rs1]